jgi:cellulose synthase/poly-beta-1,6-N-acetylglucosamine synthase-like glycosyltransferase
MFGAISEVLVYVSLFFSLFFEIFLLITYFEKRSTLKVQSEYKEPAHFPTVSIMVPCYNEEETILKTLSSLLMLDYPKDKLEILVIDDGSSDNTLKILDQFNSSNQIKVYSKPNGGKYTALNFGLQKTSGEFVGCLDADSFVEKSALKRIMNHFNDAETMAVTPAVRVHDPKNVLELMQKVEYAWGIFYRKMLDYLGAIFVTPGPFSIYRREVFSLIGDYRHAHNTEDLEIALRMQANHLKIVNAHDAIVYTVAPKTLKTLYKQRRRWTYGFLNNSLDYKFLFLNKKYGNIGLYILPMAIISIFSSIFFLFSLFWSNAVRAQESITKLMTIGPEFSLSFDWFFVSSSAAIFLTVVGIALIICILVLSRRLTDGHFYFSMDIIYFLAFYSFIVPFWLLSALFNTIFSRSVAWK